MRRLLGGRASAPAARALASSLAALGVSVLAASVAGAQDSRPCELVIRGTGPASAPTRVTSRATPGGGRDTYFGGGVDATCEGQGNRLLADSAEHFVDRGVLYLYHNVRYSEPRVRIRSNRMTYFTVDERLVAEGEVRGVTENGTRFEGPRMEYLRAKPGFRAAPSWTATGRPFVRMSPAESGAPPGTEGDSTDITADRIYSLNDSLVFASGRVILERPDMRATSDSAIVDNPREFVRLLRDPQIVGTGERPFTLDGVEIDAWSQDRELQRVVAAGEAQAVSDSLLLTADTIDLRLDEQRIQRVFSWGTRARAQGSGQDIESDSMDIRMPAQRLEELHAVGSAAAFSVPDSTRVLSDERDWITGDTLLARFETLPRRGESGERTTMREVIAEGNARAFYQVPPSGNVRGTPSLSYNRGRRITVRFAEGEMESVTVSEQASGLYLEPAAAPPDTSRNPRPEKRP